MRHVAFVCSFVVVAGCSSPDRSLSRTSSAAVAFTGTGSSERVARRAPTPWESRGVGGGGALYGPTLSPFNRDEIFMATDMLGVFHSRDFGRSWVTLPFTVMMGGTITHTQWTSHANVLFGLGFDLDGNQILERSDDDGASWSALAPSTDQMYYLSVDGRSAGRFLATDTNNLYFSKDGGATFSLVYTDTTGNGLVMGGAFWDGNEIQVGLSDGLFVSHDAGRTFAMSTLPGIPGAEGIVSFASAKQGAKTRFLAVTSTAPYAGMTGGDLASYGGLYRLDLGDTGWTAVHPNLGPDDCLSFVAMAANDVNAAYAAGGNLTTSQNVVLSTRDGGDTWRPTFLTDHNANIATGWGGEGGGEGWSFSGDVLGLGVSPNDPDRAVITDLGFVHVTDDGGLTWRAAYVQPADLTPPGHLTPAARAVVTSGVEQTSVWWLTWSRPDALFASFTDITSVQSWDGGHSWVRDANNGLTLNTTYQAIREESSGKLYAATSSKHDMYESTTTTDDNIDPYTGAIMVSSDDGAHFETLQDMGHPVIYLAIDPHHRNRLYASVIHSVLGDIYRKDLNEPAAPAVRLASPPRTNGHPFNIHVLDDGSLLASYSAHRQGTLAHRGLYDASSGVFLSTDGGASWSDRTDPSMMYWTKDVVVDPHDKAQNTWYATVFSHKGESITGGVYRTVDRGLHWTKITESIDVESIAIHPDDPNVAYYTTDTAGLWETHDLRAAQPVFTQVADYPFVQPVRVFWNPYDAGEVWVTSFGGGLRVRHE